MTKPRKPSRSGRLWGLPPGEQVFAHELRGSQPSKCLTNPGAPSQVSFHGFPPKKGALHRAVQWLTCCMRIVCKSTCGAPAMLSTHACRASTLHTAAFHHIHLPLPLRFHMLRSIQGREFATWGDRLCVRYAHSGCSCAILNRTMPDVLAPFHSYITIHAPVSPSRASTGPFATLKMHLIAYVAARDGTYAFIAHGRSPTDEF